MRALVCVGTAALAFIAACPPPGTTTTSGGGGGGRIDPDQCGAIDTSESGKKLHAFLVASAELERTSYELDASVLDACRKMATELGAPTDGDTKTLCDRVAHELDRVRAEQHFVTKVSPAVCRTDVSATAGYVAECEVGGGAGANVKCHGTCGGTCTGPCDGTCSSGDNATCSGTCTGECKGSCGGACEGYVSVDASQECEAAAEVRASIHTQCSEPKIEVSGGDPAQLAHAVAAIQSGLPALLVVAKRVELAGKALAHWGDATGQLVDATTALLADLGTRAACVTGQIAGIVQASASIQARFEVSVQASASISASAGAAP